MRRSGWRSDLAQRRSGLQLALRESPIGKKKDVHIRTLPSSSLSSSSDKHGASADTRPRAETFSPAFFSSFSWFSFFFCSRSLPSLSTWWLFCPLRCLSKWRINEDGEASGRRLLPHSTLFYFLILFSFFAIPAVYRTVTIFTQSPDWDTPIDFLNVGPLTALCKPEMAMQMSK